MHDSINILDSSKIKDYLTCPRYFYFRHICGLVSDSPNVHLIFGSAWHKAIEHMLHTNLEDVAGAFRKFNTIYGESGIDPDTAGNKTPSTALAGLTLLQENRLLYFDESKLLFTEVAGTIPISADMEIHVLIDAILHHDTYGVYILEHKTTGWATQSYVDQWPLDVSIQNYLLTLHLIYDPDQIWQLIVDALTIKRNDVSLLYVPCIYNPTITEQHIRMLLDIAAEIKQNIQLFQAGTFNFHMKPISCIHFMRTCTYHPFCLSGTDPITYYDSPPPLGLRREYWDPREHETKAKTHLSEVTL